MDALGGSAADLELISRLLSVARRRLGMELSWISSIRDDAQVFEVVDRDDRSQLELSEGDRGPFEESYCVRVLSGELPQAVPDTAANPVTASLRVTDELGIGSYVGAPILSSEGEALGMVCAVSDSASPELGAEHVRVLELVANLIGEIFTEVSPSQRRDRDVAERVRAAIDAESFWPVFQPIVSTITGEVAGVEALTRFRDPPERPDIWFSEADSVGLGIELELAACALAVERLDDLPAGVYLSVNASPRLLADSRFEELIGNHDAARIVVEITEHARIDDYAELIGALQSLKTLGARVAVDDVGAGFSSFSHVLQLSPQLLKVDLSLTRGVDSDPAKHALVAGIVTVAGQIGAEVVAEGVETEAELATLRKIGVASVQGYLIARPQELPVPDCSVPLPGKRPGVAEDDLEIPYARQFELAMRHSPIGFCVVGLDGTFFRVNSAFASMLGRSMEELLALTFQEITHPDDLEADLGLLEQCLEGKRQNYRIGKRYFKADGSIMWVDLSVVLIRSDDGRPTCFVSQIVDVTEAQLRSGSVAHESLTDEFTGLPNRLAVRTRVEVLINRGTAFGVVLCAPAGKGLRCGGAPSDDLTIDSLAQHLLSHTRNDELLARLDRDRFVLVISDISATDLDRAAERIRLMSAKDHHSSAPAPGVIDVGTAHSSAYERPTMDLLIRQAETGLGALEPPRG